MEEFVWCCCRPEQVMVDAAMSYRVEDRPAGLWIPEGTPFDHQHTFGVWMKVARLVQQLASGRSGQLLSGQNQGNFLPSGREFC